MSNLRRRQPTLDDVAKAVGVSRATVSNAYNRADQLSAGLREDVLRTAKSLGYAGPNPVARSLVTNRTGAIAFLLETGLSVAFSDPALSITLDALATEVDSEGHSLLLLPGGDDGGPRADRVLTAQADIAVAYSLGDGAPALQAVLDRGLPLVVIDHPAVPGAALVGTDDRGGAVAAARHLIELGHRRFGILAAQDASMQCLSGSGLSGSGLSGPPGGPLSAGEAAKSKFRDNRERLAGYLETLAGAGIDPARVPIWEASGISRASAMASARGLLDQTPNLTAVLCMSDELAMAALAAAKQLGLRVPADLSVVGFDDTPGARWAEPPLSTVRQDLARKGRLAGQLTLLLLAGQPLPEPTILDVELIVRQSTAPPS